MTVPTSNANPLLSMPDLPHFTVIRAADVEPAIDWLLAENRAAIAALLDSSPRTWDALIPPLEAMDDRIDHAWGPVRHLNAVMNSPELRNAYNACLPKLSAYSTELSQNERLYQAYQTLADSATFGDLSEAQRATVHHALRDFRLAGVALPESQKARYKEIMQKLSQLQSTFQDNVLDATHAWKKHLTDESQLAGLPESARALMRQNAEREGLDGWLLNLEMPCYHAVMTYADDRALRQEMYTAYVTRASDQGPFAHQWDNSAIMEDIIRLRHEVAQLLGFSQYSDYSLATKMAESSQQVIDFLEDLAKRCKPHAERDLAELQDDALEVYGIESLEVWDIGYYSEKLRQARYHLSQEDLRPYFPAPQVLNGLFALIEKLFGLKIQPLDDIEVWHPDVTVYGISDEQGLRGRFYLDLYARAHKRGGAWMDGCISRRKTAAGVQLPVAYLVCNFTPPIGDQPALLTHNEVQTLFHEMGHGLHHLATRMEVMAVAGIHGVEWDAVELPSQFMENWCFEREALDLIARHYQTNAPLPDELYERLRAAKNFQSALAMVRQLEFALFDFRLHSQYDPAAGVRIHELLQEVRQQVAVIIPPDFNRFAHSFGHIFAGGYAAGYYSYKWAEVLSADAFAQFEEQGLFNRTLGERFLRSILEVGGSRPALENFIAFRGRAPQIEALLRHQGIVESAPSEADMTPQEAEKLAYEAGC